MKKISADYESALQEQANKICKELSRQLIMGAYEDLTKCYS